MPTRKILIVCEQSAFARELVQQLAGLGYEAEIGTSQDDSRTASDVHQADLLLMDIERRTETSAVAPTNDRRGPRTIPIVYITTRAQQRSTSEAESMPYYGYLVKPFTERELHLTLELALSKHDAMRQTREMEDRFFTESIDMLCFLDFSGYFKRLNPAWERALGFSREELMSRPFIEFVHPDDRERTLKQNAAVRGGGKALAFENRYLCKDGSYRWFHWNAAPDASKSVIYSVARDVTARKQAEEEREKLVQELQAALAEVNSLREILPICSYCRKIRDDENYWHTVEGYLAEHTNTMFTHGICPSCMVNVFGPALEAMDVEERRGG
jgi:PAS domain S-box-containing protein